MEPKNSYQCPICSKYFNGLEDVMLDFNAKDCAHSNDTEITEGVFKKHMELLPPNPHSV